MSCSCGADTPYFSSFEEARDFWNRRAPDARDERIRGLAERIAILEATMMSAADSVMFDFPETAAMLRNLGRTLVEPAEGEK